MKKASKAMRAAAVAVGMLFGTVAHAGLVTNGGFESADFTGWQLTGSPDMNVVAADPAYVHSGDNAAFFGEVGGLGGISQGLATTVGQTYTLKFWLGNMGASEANTDTSSFFSFAIGGATQLASLLNNKTATELTPYDVSFVATTDLTELAFSFRQDEAFWFLDDVSVDEVPTVPVPPASVPEPGTVPLLLLAAAGWLFTRTKRHGARGSNK